MTNRVIKMCTEAHFFSIGELCGKQEKRLSLNSKYKNNIKRESQIIIKEKFNHSINI